MPPLIQVTDLPAVNALLNTGSTVLLLAGFFFIKQGHVRLHKRFMIAALFTSSLFLLSYVVYHYNVGSVRFTGVGAIRVVYFAVLVTHMSLAFAIVPLALVTLVRALRKRFKRHKAIARWTLPIWLYVSVTGIVIYLMLYQIFPS